MKIKLFFLCSICLFCSLLCSVTWHIKQDGSGNFTTIQEGINAAANSDTVLVYPNIYYENLYIENKNITLASLELTTGNPQYINSTVIDGQRIESCIYINGCQTGIVLQGFTLQNGSGYLNNSDSKLGGGICSTYSCLYIVNNIIKHNVASIGGGIFSALSDITLINNNIHKNSATHGGGLSLADSSVITFNEIHKNSVYDNNAGAGYDIFAQHCNHVHVVLDTFSIQFPDEYYAKSFDQFSQYNTYFTFDIEVGLHDLISNDLYVSEDGDDSNSGLSFDEPLRNISTAVRLIDVSGGINRTIHVSSGTYSHASNQQVFPFGLKENLSIIGEDKNNTIIINDYCPTTIKGFDLEGYPEIMNFSFFIDYEYPYSLFSISFSEYIKLKNCIFTGHSGKFFGSLGGNNYVELDNITIHDASTQDFPVLIIDPSDGIMNNVTIDNCTVLNNPMVTYSAFELVSNGEFTINNCRFTSNITSGSNGFWGWNVGFIERFPYISTKTISNCLFANNITDASNNVNINGEGYYSINNCTFVNNNSTFATLKVKGNILINNTIMYDPDNTYEISMYPASSGFISTLDVSHSNIHNGENGIYNMNNINIINWNEGNIDEDPFFLEYGDDPYQLSATSPCIDTGTPDISGFSLPPWDLLNNHRVWDGDGNGIAVIDMGCYEYGSEPYVEFTQHLVPDIPYGLTNYPNPFNPSTTISFELTAKDTKDAKLEIYNIKGQKVKTLLDCKTAPGKYNCIWNGEDENGKRVSSGQYTARLTINGEEKAVRKIMLVK